MADLETPYRDPDRTLRDLIVTGLVSAAVAGVVSVVVVALGIAIHSGLEHDDEDWGDAVNPVTLAVDRTHRRVFEDGDEGPHDYQFSLPADAAAVTVTVDGGDTDVDLRTAFGIADAESGSWWHSATSGSGREEIRARRHDVSGFGDEPLIARVQPYRDDDEGQVAYTIEARVVRRGIAGECAPGERVPGRLTEENDYRLTHVVRLPPGERRVRVDLLDVRADLDLCASFRRTAFDTDDAEYSTVTRLARETLLIERDTEEPQSGEPLYVTVVDRTGTPRPHSYTLLTTIGHAPPEGMLELPTWPADPTARQRAMDATVEIVAGDSWGSGTVVHPDGLILTCHHVVKPLPKDGPWALGVVVAFTTDPTRLALESFRARVEASDPQSDLALLRIVSDFYGNALDPGLRFPALPLSWDAPALDSPLITIAYPDIGGWSGRAPMTVSRGVVGGFAIGSQGRRQIKTDAIIATASSGGAALDAGYRLIGVPAAARWETDSGSATLGYVIPLGDVPDSWRELIEAP